MDTFGEFQKDRNGYFFSGEPLVYQSSDYDCAFQRSMESMKPHVDVCPILVNSAQEVAYSQFSTYFSDHEKLNVQERKKVVEDYFSDAGFGKISLRALHAKGGYVETQFDNHALVWKRKYGTRKDQGSSFFVLGFLCGVTEAVFDIAHGTFDGKQSACLTMGDSKSRFEIFRGRKKALKGSPKLGASEVLSSDKVSEDKKVLEAWSQLATKGSEESGTIEIFGQNLTLQYANYYCLVSIRVLMEVEKKIGRKGVGLARKNMIEVSHHGAVGILGGFLKAEEWRKAFELDKASKEELVEITMQIMETLGWGNWVCPLINENGETTFKVRGGFESNAFEKLLGTVKEPISYFLYGGALGLMNLVYNGVLDGQTEIDDRLLEATFKGDDKFMIKAAKARSGGDGLDVVAIGR